MDLNEDELKTFLKDIDEAVVFSVEETANEYFESWVEFPEDRIILKHDAQGNFAGYQASMEELEEDFNNWWKHFIDQPSDHSIPVKEEVFEFIWKRLKSIEDQKQ